MGRSRKCLSFTKLLLTQVLTMASIMSAWCEARYVHKEEPGSPSRLRFTSGYLGFYNATIKESLVEGSWSSIKCNMKMGMYIFDWKTQVKFEIDDTKTFLVRSERVEDFYFLRLAPRLTLNFDTKALYRINVLARNIRTNEIMDRTKVYVQVLDVNEFSPQFLNSSIEVSVNEHLTVGSQVFKVKAVDRDGGQNGAIYYHIQQSDLDSARDFSLDPHSGALTVIRPLSFNVKRSYLFHIIARDRCPFETLRRTSNPLPVRIIVCKYVNKERTMKFDNTRWKRGKGYHGEIKFTKTIHNAVIQEMAPPYTSILVVSAKNTKANQVILDNVVYGISEGNGKGHFQLNSRTGELYTLKDLNYMETPSYNLSVIAYYMGSVQARAHIFIQVEDSNNHSPTFEKSFEEIETSEETPIGQVIYTAKATDLDKGENARIMYALANVNSTPFEIDIDSGQVKVRERLDRDAVYATPDVFYIRIRAMDFGLPVRREAEMILKVHVKEINDNHPVLPFSSCILDIEKGTAVGTAVKKLVAVDLDMMTTSKLIYSIEPRSDNQLIDIEQTTQEIKIGSGIKLANLGPHLFQIKAYDGELYSEVLNLSVTVAPNRGKHAPNITCIDSPTYANTKIFLARRKMHPLIPVEKPNIDEKPVTNLHRPQFIEKPEASIKLKENVPVGTIISKVVAVDSDLRCYGLVLYSIISGNLDSNLAIDMLNGTLRVSGTIDRESRSHYALKVRAWDSGTPRHYTDTDVVIDIEDLNDNAPKFSNQSYQVKIQENSEPGITLLTLSASDPDQGINGQVSYVMISDLKDVFALNSYSGILKLKQGLDHETQSEYWIDIQAVDSSSDNQQISQVQVRVIVEDLNDTPPRCIPKFQTVEISKDLPIGTVIGRFTAFDPDSGNGGKVTYHFLRNKDKRLFTLDQSSGILRTNISLSSEKTLRLNISILAKDSGKPSLSTPCYMVIQLKPVVSYERPIFQTSEHPVIREVDEFASIGTNVLSLTAVLEGSGELEYSLVDGAGLGKFSVGKKTGVLVTTQQFNKNSICHFWLTLHASLKENPEIYSNLPLLVRVKRQIQRPPYFNPPVYRVTVRENLNAGALVVNLFAVDPDRGFNQEHLRFSIFSGNKQGHFKLSESGSLTTAIKLDREKRDMYQLNVSVVNDDKSPPRSFGSVLVTVDDDNDHTPTFGSFYYFVYALEQAEIKTGPPTPIFKVTAFDQDTGSNGAVEYTIQNQGTPFQIDIRTGLISSKEQLTTLSGFFYLRILAKDKGTPHRQSQTAAEIKVISKPTNPMQKLAFKRKTYNVELDESISPVLVPKRINVFPLLDVRGTNSLYYSIISGNDDGKFVMKSGIDKGLFLVSELDHETKSFYNLTIKVTDGLVSATTNINIIVRDLNDNHPTTSQTCYEATTPENHDPIEVITVKAMDQDSISRNTLTYLIIGGSLPTTKNSFVINEKTGQIKAQRSFDRELEQQHILILKVRDQATVPLLYAIYCIVVNIGDENDHSPRFSEKRYQTAVSGKIPSGTPVLRVLAVDDDVGSNALLKYSIRGGNIHGHFHLHSTTGIITLGQKLKSQERRETILNVEVCDSGDPSFKKNTTVEITLLPSGPTPGFRKNHYVVRVNENEPPIPITEVTISNHRVSYEIKSYSDTDCYKMFHVDLFSGVVSTLVSLDAEQLKMCSFYVTAWDGLSFHNQTKVTAIFQDMNDNKPVFENNTYEGSVIEGFNKGSEVIDKHGKTLVVKATDADFGDNAKISYSIVETSARQFFSIQPQTGVLKTKQVLDREKISEFQFHVQASDAGSPKLFEFVKVKVSVKDINDGMPRFSEQAYNVQVYLPVYNGTGVLSVKATDGDTNAFGDVTYSITSYKNIFSIHPKSGEIKIKDASGVTMKNYVLGVSASDQIFSSFVPVYVTFVTIEKSNFKFSQDVFHASLKENSNNVTTVFFPTVVGYTIGQCIRFSIVNPNDFFVINSNTGAISTKEHQLFDREKVAFYILIVQARYNNPKGRVAQAIVNITIEDENDNKPVFVGEYYQSVHVDATAHTPVIQVKATDADSGSNADIRYTITSGAQGMFVIDSRKGQISVKEKFIKGRTPSKFILKVEASDLGTPQLSAVTQVEIPVVNEDMPAFSKNYDFTVSEGAVIGSKIGVIEAKGSVGRDVYYSISKGDDWDQFSLSFMTGELTVLGKLDRNVKPYYHLTIQATDSKTGSWSETECFIALSDQNNNRPMFEKPFYIANVPEDVDIGTPVVNVKAVDLDIGTNARISYSLSLDDNNPFAIDAKSGQVSFASELDFEAKRRYYISIQARDSGSPSLTSNTYLEVNVQDVNDNPPTFDRAVYEFYVAEFRGSGQFLGKVQAVDLDDVSLNKLRYTLSETDLFNIDSITGVVSLLRQPTASDYKHVKLQCTDGKFTSLVDVSLKVKQMNRHKPIFVSENLPISIEENSASSSFLTIVSATDKDEGIFGKVKYSIESILLRKMFVINEDNGEIFTNVSLDREKEKSGKIVLPIRATDGGGLFGFAKVVIDIIDENDNQPRFEFTSYEAIVSTNTRVGDIVLETKAVDADSGSNGDITYSTSGLDETPLELDKKTGVFKLKKALPRNTEQSYRFMIKATDNGYPVRESLVSVKINVVTSDDKLIKFDRSSHSLSVDENEQPGYRMTSVKASLGGSNQGITYQFITGNLPSTDASKVFKIDEATGVIHLIGQVDHETIQQYRLLVKAYRNNSPTMRGFVTLTVNVNPVNDNTPVFDSKLYEITVTESLLVGTKILQVSATDLDDYAKSDIRYRFGNVPKEIKNTFKLNNKNGWITTLVQLDRETKSYYEFEIKAQDGKKHTRTTRADVAKVKITVMDTNDSPPTFLQSSYVSRIKEDYVIGEKVVSVLAEDPDLNPEIEYYITEGNERGHFKINQRNSEIMLVSALDREKVPEYKLTVAAYDGVFMTSVPVQIILIDTNDNKPVCKKAFYNVQIEEGIHVRKPVATIEAVDPDSNDKLGYSIQGDVNKFDINQNTGVLSPLAPLDVENHSKGNCNFKVLVTDSAGRSCSSDVYVHVTDINDNKPVFTQNRYVETVHENATVSAMVTRVQAIDADQGLNRQVKYSFKSSGDRTFSIQETTGIIVLEKPLSRNRQRLYNLTVIASDGGVSALTSTAAVKLVVLGESDSPPKFTKMSYNFNVSEKEVSAFEIGEVYAQRADDFRRDTILYEIVAGDKLSFNLDKFTGRLSLKESLDYEKVKSKTLNVQARYSSVPSLSSVVSVTIHVLDENDNKPTFSMPSYSKSIDENVRPGFFVIQVFAEDKDEGTNGQVRYSLLSTTEQLPFAIDNTTGIVTVNGTKSLDREEIASYTLVVRAHDSGRPRLHSDAHINITVADLNDNPPEVDQPNASVIVQETQSIGSVIFSWTATDKDSTKNGPPFKFTLIEGDSSKFIVQNEDSVKGSVFPKTRLSTKLKSEYTLVVRVSDSGSPPQTSICRLTVHVVEQSRYRPHIHEPTTFFLIIKSDPSDALAIGRVKVTDKDRHDIHQFLITSGNDDGTFSINQFNGEITGRPRQGVFTIGVEVTDGEYTDASTIKIIVNQLTSELYENSVVLGLRDVLPEEFMKEKMPAFATVISSITAAGIENVIVWSVQQSPARRQTRDLTNSKQTDMVFAVRKKSSKDFLKPSNLQTILINNRDVIEDRIGVTIVITTENICSSSPCERGRKCIPVVKPLENSSGKRGQLMSGFQRTFECFCLDGTKGPNCAGITACVSNPCGDGEKCIANGDSYTCKCTDPTKCNILDEAITLDGSGYIKYVLRQPFDTLFKSIAVDFRTEEKQGMIFYAHDRDYCYLEIIDGRISFKFDYGSGPGHVRINDIQVNDGEWHHVEVTRVGNFATVRLDNGKFQKSGQSPGKSAKINLNGNIIYFGAGVVSAGSVLKGFKGCLRRPVLMNQGLPWTGNGQLIQTAQSFSVKAKCKDSGMCANNPCPYFSICKNKLSSYRCQCLRGHVGHSCSAQLTCVDRPCRNGGTCTYLQISGKIEYRCSCPSGYSGAQCQNRVGPCGSSPCKNNGNCVNTGNSYECQCSHRYQGRHCEIDTQPCLSSPCYHGAQCIELYNDFRCDCPAGKLGKRCGYGEYCFQHDCANGGACQETFDGPICKCKDGYMGQNCRSDVNECLKAKDPCQGQGSCINTIGSYFCNCTDGKNGKSCRTLAAAKGNKDGLGMTTIILIAAPIALVIFIVLIVCYVKRRKTSRHEPTQQNPDVKYPCDYYELDSYPPHPPPRHDCPPNYYEDQFEESDYTMGEAAMYDPSAIALSGGSTLSSHRADSPYKPVLQTVDMDNDSISKEKMRVKLRTFGDDSRTSSPSPRHSGAEYESIGSGSDGEHEHDKLNGPYHWDYADVPEDVMRRSKANRQESREGSCMGLQLTDQYEETPQLPERPRSRRSSLRDFDDGSAPAVPQLPKYIRLSKQSLPKEGCSPGTIRAMDNQDGMAVKPDKSPSFHRTDRSPHVQRTERSPHVQRSHPGSDLSLSEPYPLINTRLTRSDFNNRYSLTLDDDDPRQTMYLQDVIGEYAAPPSETCPSDIESCTRPSLSEYHSEVDGGSLGKIPRRILPSEISMLDDSQLDGFTETSYNSDEEDYCENDPLDPDDTRRLERDIKLLIKDIQSKTADV